MSFSKLLMVTAFQNCVMAVRSAPSPQLANGRLSTFDGTIKNFSQLLYTRYIHDIICISKRYEIDSKLLEIISIHPSLSFTVEIEKDCRSPCLDMIIYNVTDFQSSVGNQRIQL